MKYWATVAVLGLLVMRAWAQDKVPLIGPPPCESKHANETALVALNFLNAQHTHGYKYALKHIEKMNILFRKDEPNSYLLELDLVETKCHVLDPTPVSQCPFRPKPFAVVEADCDFVVSDTAQGLSVVAFKCKTKTAQDGCVGCPMLIHLNDTDGLRLVEASLHDFNTRHNLNTKFALLEIGRLESQVVGGGNRYIAEYAIIGTNCTSHDDDHCIPQNHTVATHGFCVAEGSSENPQHNKVDCKILKTNQAEEPPIDATVKVPQLLHAHTSGHHYDPAIHDTKHHKLTEHHDPAASGLLSGESFVIVCQKKALS
ncbi:alpha-2-HS-glycoprotein-like isoform X7 [Myxocyprinus asiaticus]|uniref:alpha-2-HS-glycoprotein-like isoform X1 n=1 Tax=Myxocyprinus asiaticus TaxID=70543 RepID=UPI002223426A|nr:alpha-2-HS-glycoprotein-like isoform X1 [Myxocyprinus asiaticus]XP_051556627.1 alpha-2-HS-glycoprotein-like isoform X2 [Myxocyprinus asiaticus]XP_051556628.1 alpha-2-HS-glycoprotein-like isoform X3 [Myxocyprinus asiaticus]XP_051556629.1 alpha-2-HS-glycoprotein-like isoform X4 [Myxocyprinus asiaticus]XP_051556630.1 alpha-2-HS-glycoprotein-like isoform X5 [Myxocyprinus asiaticus]XP_051556631.1 alpha-2-HS-glycoprotein-like isoform X6 [Myxocyprinus asiaticus]XP_051556632.1 alpha-2-HS-glycoprot